MASKRLLSLDVMRGITIAGMILVNNSGSGQYTYAPLKHVQWDGLTPTDLVFPFFMFIMGISMYMSLGKFNYTLSWESFRKIAKRTILIFLVGLGLNLFKHVLYNGFTNFENLRILGVMQRLAIAYGFGSIIGLIVPRKYLLHTAFGILIGYAALLLGTDSMILSTHNIIAKVDIFLFGESHLYTQRLADGTRIPFDPEGFLSAVGSIAQVLLGFFVGKMIIEYKNDREKLLGNLFIFGTIILFIGFLFSYGFPINKKIWSSTFVLVSSGFGCLLLGLLIWIIDIHDRKKWSLFFESFGINPLYLYVQAEMLSVVLSIVGFKAIMYDQVFAPVFGNYGGALAWAIFFVILNWIPGYFLYKKQIYIKL